MRLTTKHFPDGRTYANVPKEELTLQEKRHIMEGDLGYCAAHHILYRRTALIQCVLYLLACKCDDPCCTGKPKLAEIGPCDEWS